MDLAIMESEALQRTVPWSVFALTADILACASHLS